eukprot:NODE_132_length_18298_cov_0.443101.p15 type:complete len:107 gc:universal NODE_132_length_18298_cov_0.443101:2765-3085(+)
MYISVTFSSTRLQCLSTAFGIANNFLLFLIDIIILCRFLIALIISLNGPFCISTSSFILFSSSGLFVFGSMTVVDILLLGVEIVLLFCHSMWPRLSIFPYCFDIAR